MAERYPKGDSTYQYSGSNNLKEHSSDELDSFEVIPNGKYNPTCCRLKTPAFVSMQLYCMLSDYRHTHSLKLTKMPNKVSDLKNLISDSLNIPTICQLKLTVNNFVLLDNQLMKDIPIREGDQMNLTYFGMCSDKMEYLIKQGNFITKFCEDYIDDLIRCDSNNSSNTVTSPRGKKSRKKNFFRKTFKKIIKRKSSNNIIDRNDINRSPTPPIDPPNDVLRDAGTVRWALNYMYSDALLPWKEETTLCQRLYLVQTNMVTKILSAWKWARENSDVHMQRLCMLTIWDFGENWAERMYLFSHDVHLIALDVFLDPEVDEETKNAAIGLIAGFGEFPLGQKILGTNQKFLRGIANYLCDTRSSFIQTVIGGMLHSLASCHVVPKHMYEMGILEEIKQVVDSLSFYSVDDFDLSYTFILLFMFLLKSPDYKIPKEYSVRVFTQYFTEFSDNVTDDLIAESEQENQTSWASMLPFIDLFFVPYNSLIAKESAQNEKFIQAYLSCAQTLFSAMMIHDENVQLFLDEDLYEYLICLSWHYKNDREIGKFMVKIMKRFNPTPFRIPSLYHIATAKYAFVTKGLGAALEAIHHQIEA